MVNIVRITESQIQSSPVCKFIDKFHQALFRITESVDAIAQDLEKFTTQWQFQMNAKNCDNEYREFSKKDINQMK